MDPNDQSKLQTLADELGNDVPLLKKLAADYKAGGFKALAADAPELLAEGRKDWAAISNALPVIKAGYKTTEFWLVAAVLLGNAGYFAVTGKTLPFDLNATFAGLVGVYAVVRGLTKKAPPAPPAPPAAAT